MLSIKNEDDKKKMIKYYRTRDMLNLLYFFPNLSPIKDLVIVESVEDYLNNKDYFDSFDQNRVDTLIGRSPILGIENSGNSSEFYNTLLKVKEKDPYGVLVLFNVNCSISERYDRYAGISVLVSLRESVVIEAVSKGFDGREVSKGISVHEIYNIPWYDLRSISIGNFRDYQIFQISEEEYKVSRSERIKFLKSIGLKESDFVGCIPKSYEVIPNFIWINVIGNLLKVLEESEDILESYGCVNFVISGHTEGKEFVPWQMFDKSRYIH